MQTTYGALLPNQDSASLQSRSCSDMSTGTGLGALAEASSMLLGGASSLEAALTADDSADSSPTVGGIAPHLVFGSLDESDGALVRAWGVHGTPFVQAPAQMSTSALRFASF